MKKIYFAMLFGLLSTAIFAQTKAPKESKEKEETEEQKEMKPVIPAVVLQAFSKDYPGTKASWDAEEGSFEAVFKLDGIEASATYSDTGHRQETEIEMKASELPASIAEYVKKNYPTHKLIEAAKMTDDKNVITYEAEISKDGKSTDLIFDSSGKFIRQGAGE